MGMGEPLANYDRVWAAVDRLHGDMGISARHLTLSTVGSCPASAAWPPSRCPVNLAVSLHAANDELRDALVPINRRYPLDDAGRGLRRLRGGQRAPPVHRVGADRRRQRPGAATPPSWPRSPARWAPTSTSSRSTRRRAIPWSVRSRHGAPASVTSCAALGVNATIRVTRGAEIDAACGQLAASPRLASARRTDRPVAPRRPRSLERAHGSSPSSVPRCSGSSCSMAASSSSRSWR